jgi:hypothetical protein
VIVYRTREDWFITNRILAGDVTTSTSNALVYGDNWREFPTTNTNSSARKDIQAGTGDGFARFDHTAQASHLQKNIPHIQSAFRTCKVCSSYCLYHSHCLHCFCMKQYFLLVLPLYAVMLLRCSVAFAAAHSNVQLPLQLLLLLTLSLTVAAA